GRPAPRPVDDRGRHPPLRPGGLGRVVRRIGLRAVTVRLPLFPLGSVLFPGLVLPLNIFEARYRALARDLLAIPEDEPRQFGVVAIRDGSEVAPSGPGAADAGPASGFGPDLSTALHRVGCVADTAS